MPNGFGKIALIGSGELTASMVEVHKYLLSTVPVAGTAYFLDTPAGFQPNADDISMKAQEYFREKIQHPLDVASYKSAELVAEYDHQLLAKRLAEAGFVLVGPGSPTYMLRQLAGSSLLASLKNIVSAGGCLAVASAAALTVGLKTLPVYEIYKVGEKLHWQDGLNLLGDFNIDTVVIPHWDNGEGGSHDTRYCYMGDARFSKLRKLLPENTLYMGIDEHTACIIDFSKTHAEIRGQGKVTLLQGEKQQSFAQGEIFPFALLHHGLSADMASTQPSITATASTVGNSVNTFWEIAHDIENRFQVGRETRDYRAVTLALLDLDSHIATAMYNFESDEDISQAREIYRDLIFQLSIELQTIQQTMEMYLEPLVESVLNLRKSYKEKQEWSQADELRRVLRSCNIHVEDTKQGPRYHFKGSGKV